MSRRKSFFELLYVACAIIAADLMFTRKTNDDIFFKGIFMPSEDYGEIHLKLMKHGDSITAFDRYRAIGTFSMESLPSTGVVMGAMKGILSNVGALYINIDRRERILFLYSNSPLPQAAFKLKSSPSGAEGPLALVSSLDSLAEEDRPESKKLIDSIIYLTLAGFFSNRMFLVYPKSIAVVGRGRRRKILGYRPEDHLDMSDKALRAAFEGFKLVIGLNFVKNEVIVTRERVGGTEDSKHTLYENDIYDPFFNFERKEKDLELRDIIEGGDYEKLVPLVTDEQREKGQAVARRLLKKVPKMFYLHIQGISKIKKLLGREEE
jgi:hypothetical protein